MDQNTQAEPLLEAPEPVLALPEGKNPGKIPSIVGFILSFFLGLSVIGLALSIVGLVKSSKAGYKHGLSIAGIILSGLNILLVTPIFAAIVIVGLNGVATRADAEHACSVQGSTGTVTINNTMFNCSPFNEMNMQ